MPRRRGRTSIGIVKKQEGMCPFTGKKRTNAHTASSGEDALFVCIQESWSAP